MNDCDPPERSYFALHPSRRFIEIVRCGGAVWWVGAVDYVRMGPLVVMHGNRHSKHVATASLADFGHQVSVMFGHVHRLTSAAVEGEDFTVQAISSGKLALPLPHYIGGLHPRGREQQGTAFADVDLCGREVNFTNLLFNADHERTWVRFERLRDSP